MYKCKICLKKYQKLRFKSSRMSICGRCTNSLNKTTKTAESSYIEVNEWLKRGMLKRAYHDISSSDTPEWRIEQASSIINNTHTISKETESNWVNKLLADTDNSKMIFKLIRAERRGLIHRHGIKKSGYPNNWEESLAPRIRSLDNYTCICCNAQDIELHVHHIIYLSNGGTHTKNNLVTLCRKCHEKEHETEFDFGEVDMSSRDNSIIPEDTNKDEQLSLISNDDMKDFNEETIDEGILKLEKHIFDVMTDWEYLEQKYKHQQLIRKIKGKIKDDQTDIEITTKAKNICKKNEEFVTTYIKKYHPLTYKCHLLNDTLQDTLKEVVPDIYILFDDYINDNSEEVSEELYQCYFNSSDSFEKFTLKELNEHFSYDFMEDCVGGYYSESIFWGYDEAELENDVAEATYQKKMAEESLQSLIFDKKYLDDEINQIFNKIKNLTDKKEELENKLFENSKKQNEEITRIESKDAILDHYLESNDEPGSCNNTSHLDEEVFTPRNSTKEKKQGRNFNTLKLMARKKS